jgi:hypothetical protein
MSPEARERLARLRREKLERLGLTPPTAVGG